MKGIRMAGKIKKNQRAWMVILLLVCVVAIVAGAVGYIARLRGNLMDQAVQNVMTVTRQQQQAFDNFISQDRERLHSYAKFFANNGHAEPEEIQHQLALFSDVDASYTVFCLDEGWYCVNSTSDIQHLSQEELDIYLALDESGVRDPFVSIFSGTPRFAVYERFTFANGHKGLVQKAYDRSKVSETFSLSFYDNRGLAYVVNKEGDILLRSVGLIGDRYYDNIFEILNGNYSDQDAIEAFAAALSESGEGSMTFTGERGAFVYTYVPVDSVEDWYLVSIIPSSAITEAADKTIADSQIALLLLAALLVGCAAIMALVWRTGRALAAKDRAIEYQERLFDIFATYLSTNTNDVYMMVDQETEEVEYVSPNAQRVLGLGQDEDIFGLLQASDIASSPEDVSDLYSEVRDLSPGQSIEPRNIERVNPATGEHSYFRENAYCVDVQGKSKRVIYISDRTREQKTQDSLAEALHMAQAASKAKSSFLSNVSHDIRTPMNAIIGFLALMKDEADNPETVREYIQRIDAASQHLLGLINDVLDMNKIESGSATLNISEMNLAEVIGEINTIIRPQAKEKNQTFDLFASHLKYEHLLGDKLRVNQILINLLSNAVKYTQTGGSIQMRVEELPQVVNSYSRIRFTVSDNGIGMSEDFLKVIFDPFSREESKATHGIQGTGLGMAITKSLVDLMGGTIHVESEPGKGSTFTVELELRIEEREDDPEFWVDHRVSRMIVTDDDEEVCHNIVKAMSKVGVETDYSTDGETAVQMMRAAREAGRPYDLILLDWKMPNLNGLETARLIRKNYSKKIPILLLTAYDWSEIEQEAMEIGIKHFMPKPFFMNTFKEAIRRVMDDRKEVKATQTDVVQGKNVLVVDDIEVNRIILSKILGTMGAVCHPAGNGQEALETFESSRPGAYDLILMDVQMPVMDGYQATRAIRASGHPDAKSVPIIAMTANAFVDDVRAAIESGMDAHIAKPVQIDNLKSTIQQVLGNRNEQETAAQIGKEI